MRLIKWFLGLALAVVVLLFGSYYVSGELPIPSLKLSEDRNHDLKVKEDQNSDVYAWLRIEGTPIDYPIVQHSIDDSYYLSHDLDGEETYYGAIFTECINTKTFEDSVTLVYGHAITDGSMFGSLSSFLDGGFMDRHSVIRIETATHQRDYEVFASHVYLDDHLYHTFNLEAASGVEAFLSGLEERVQTYGGVYKRIDLDGDTDKFLVLSTCERFDDSQRTLVYAKLVNVREV